MLMYYKDGKMINFTGLPLAKRTCMKTIARRTERERERERKREKERGRDRERG